MTIRNKKDGENLVRDAIKSSLTYNPELTFPNEAVKNRTIHDTVKDFLSPACRSDLLDIFKRNRLEQLAMWCDTYVDDWKDTMVECEIQTWKDGEYDYLLEEQDPDFIFKVDGMPYTRQMLKDMDINLYDYLINYWSEGYYANVPYDQECIITSSGYIGETEQQWDSLSNEEFYTYYNQLTTEQAEQVDRSHLHSGSFTDEGVISMYTSVDGCLYWIANKDELTEAIRSARKDST